MLRLLGDLAAAAMSFYGAFWVRMVLPIPFTQFLLPERKLIFFVSNWWLILATQAAALYFFGFYDPPKESSAPERTRRLLAAVALQGVLLAGYFFLAGRRFPRSVLVLFVLFNFLLILAWRSLVSRLYRAPRRRVAIVGCGRAARELAAKLRAARVQEVEIMGFVPTPEDSLDQAGCGLLGPRLGGVEDLPELLRTGTIDDVILAAEARPWQTRLLDGIASQAEARGNVLLLPGPLESLIGRMRYRWVDDLPLIDVVRQSEWRINRPVKRLFDIAGALILLVLTSPLLLFAALSVALFSGLPVLFRQQRIGRGRRPFTVWKLRTMTPDAEKDTGEVLAQPDDPRITPVGALLRRLRLDELPQLINVLLGSMSLVGPRPERPGFVETFLSEVPGYAERFAVPPGLTGLAQVHGDYLSTPANKLRYDLAYIANWSPWLDLAILFRTIKIVLTSRGT